MQDLYCPYCNAPITICHDDGFGYQEGVKHQQECWKCSKTFVFETSVIYYYDAEKADCLNDANHLWEPTNTYPKFLTRMECNTCGQNREPTSNERDTFGIPTYTDYLEEKEKSKL